MIRKYLPIAILSAALWLPSQVVHATQGHSGIEGVYVHQVSHVFFCISMGILIFWLKARGLMQESGWRYIGYSAFLFIIWSADAFFVHLLDEQLQIIETHRMGTWQIHIATSSATSWLQTIYYVAKLDHLFCVPAMLFLYIGLRRQVATAVGNRKDGDGKGPA